jgi:hypothetical protein
VTSPDANNGQTTERNRKILIKIIYRFDITVYLYPLGLNPRHEA